MGTVSRSTLAKTERWLDLMAALLAHRRPQTFEELARYVPAYLTDGSVLQRAPSGSVKRMFERDKKELRAFGVPITSIGEEGDAKAAYCLTPDAFYLPYLTVATSQGRSEPSTVDRYGYRALDRLAFEPDELSAVASAIERISALGDPALQEHANSAMRKLAFDLPIGVTTAGLGQKTGVSEDRAASDTVLIVSGHDRADPRALAQLSDALIRRKSIEFDYRSMNSDTATKRHVEPYGLFFLSGHWYLIGRDIEKDSRRNFRVSRIESLEVNRSREATPDYLIPRSFKLREHAQSRPSWELGDEETISVVVDFKARTGAAIAGAARGETVDGHPTYRSFRVRRLDVFARWLMTFCGQAQPIAPAELVAVFQTCVNDTLSQYQSQT